MTKIGFMLLLLILASCGSDNGTNTAGSPAPDTGSSILRFQSGTEELKLASLQVDKNIYPDVTLRLAQDNTWSIKSIGKMRPPAVGESAQAVLTAPAGTVLSMGWRPTDATIAIRRLHIDAKVFGNVPLRLVGSKWHWGNDLQAEDDSQDLQDLQELKALTMADYQANPALEATETHHTVLQSSPGSGTQSYPLKLDTKVYKFCMDQQDEGADRITLLDPAGNAVVDLKAGDACVTTKLDAGRYTMRHVYDGQGKSRTVFIRPDATKAAAATPAASTAPRRSALNGIPSVPVSYYPNGLSGLLSLDPGEVALFTGANCQGPVAIVRSTLTMATSLYPYLTSQPLRSLLMAPGSLLLGLSTTASFSKYNSYNNVTEANIFSVGNVYISIEFSSYFWPPGPPQTMSLPFGCVDFSSSPFTSWKDVSGYTDGGAEVWNALFIIAATLINISIDATAISIQTNQCDYCDLTGINLQNLDLTGAKLQHSILTNASLGNTNLTNADLRYATLQGASMSNANLEAANLCSASLNGQALSNGMSGTAATLSGAHLKNANLYGANLDGADFSNASFYSSVQGAACQPSSCEPYAVPNCANAYKAQMSSTRFTNAYLAGVDMSNVAATGADFNGAILFGVSFNGARLSTNTSTGNSADFSHAYLQGANFNLADVTGANFNSAYTDYGSNNTCMQTYLNNEFTAFPGYKGPSADGSSCVSGAQQNRTCIQYVYSTATLPKTDASNTCPDGANGPCDSRWGKPRTPLSSSSRANSNCFAATTSGQLPLCDGFAQPLNTCW